MRGASAASIAAALAFVVASWPTLADDGGAAPAPAGKPTKPPSESTCGCARPRLLRDGKEVALGEATALAAWLEGGGRSRLETFERTDEPGGMRTIAPPVAEVAFDLSPYEGVTESRARLVKLYATAPDPAPFFVGVLRPPSKTAGDVVRARIDLTAPRTEPPEPGAPALLSALHLGPLEERDSPGCGPYTSHRLAFGAPDGGAEPAAFLVTVRPEEGPPRTALVDVRHARTFGLGRVPVCDHGVPLEVGEAGELVVRTVSRGFALGPQWRFHLTGAADGAQPAVLEMPEQADPGSVENPFDPAYRTPLERLLSDDTDHAALGAMVFVLVGAAAFASVFWGGRRRRKRQLVEVKCPSCDKPLALDLGDPDTDGMFCPACGKASVFVTFEPDGTPRARVLKLEGDKDGS